MASEVGILLGYGTLGGLLFLLVPLLWRMLVCCFGFTCWGVRQNSYASEWHRMIGNVEAGSRFSHYQSYGARPRGTPCGIYAGLFLFGAFFAVVLFIMNHLEFTNLEPATNSTVFPINFTTVGSNSTDFSTMESDLTTMLRFSSDSSTIGSKLTNLTTTEPVYKLNDLVDQLSN